MIAILPIQPDVLQLIAEETELAAEGPVWGYLAADGKTMLGYVIVEKAEPVRVIALQCEDFAIAKYFALCDLGFPASQMRIVVLKDTLRNLDHAVTAVYLDGDAWILDNLSNAVLSHKRLSHYRPQFSVNEEYRWAHLTPSAPKKTGR